MIQPLDGLLDRRCFLATGALWGANTALACAALRDESAAQGAARVAITMDLEMSRDYPQRGEREWDYQKGNLDEPTKQYAVRAAQLVREYGGVVHFFCVGRVLEQPDVTWLRDIAAAGHPIGNHTYDHVNVLATVPREAQFRFQRSPWLIGNKTAAEVIRENVAMTNEALRGRLDIAANGFRTPGGFSNGLTGREDIQQLLIDQGFRWVSSLYPGHRLGEAGQEPTPEVYDDIVRAQSRSQPFVYPSGLIEIPMSPISDVTAFRSQRWQLDWFLEATRRAVRWAIEHGAVFDFLCHPSCLVVEDPDLASIRLICELVRESADRAQLVGLDRIAETVPQR